MIFSEHKEKHEFAIHVSFLSLLVKDSKVGDEITLSDDNLFHRIIHVLRIKVGQSCILFDKNTYIVAILNNYKGKKCLDFEIQLLELVKPLDPTIIFLLPLLKRDDYETVLYSLTELGVNFIQPVFTQKTAHQWTKKDDERANRILIAAAEQSKNFSYPDIKDPISLELALKRYEKASLKIFFEPHGSKFFEVTQSLHQSGQKDIVLLIGPEGDLSAEEKLIVKNNNFIFCALTPTVIRSVQAAALGAGFIRSLLISGSIEKN